MSELKKNIAKLTKLYGIAYSKLERQAGLSQNFISNILSERSRSPNIDAVIKLAKAFNVSIDELVGHTKKDSPNNTDILAKNTALFIEIIRYVCDSIAKQDVQKATSADKFIEVVKEIYRFSSKNNKNKLDKEFADCYIKTFEKNQS